MRFSGTRREAVYAVIVVLLAAMVYLNSLGNGFVYDDHNQLVNNPWIRDFKSIPAILTHEVWGFQSSEVSSFYRPTMHLLNMLIYPFSGLDPAGYHLANLLLHSANSLLVFLLALALFGEGAEGGIERTAAALAAGVVFAVHPVHTEAVDWIGGSPDLMLVLFSLSALLLFAKRKWPVLQGLFFLLAMLSKEPGVTLLLVLPLFACALEPVNAGKTEEGFRTSRGPRKAVAFWGGSRNDKKKYIRFLPVAAAALVYFAMRIYALKGFFPNRINHPDMGGLFEVENAPFLFARYMAKLIFPVGLNIGYDFHPAGSFFAPRAIMGFAAATVFVGLLAIAFRKNRKLFFALCLILLPLLPVLYLAPLGDLVFGERYLYLPSVGFALAVGWMYGYFYKRAKIASLAAGVALAALLAVGVVCRNPVWKSDFSLWSDAVSKSPSGYVPLTNLAVEYGNMGKTDQAVALFKRAEAARPGRYEAYLLEGQTYQMVKNYSLAETAYKTALKANPKHTETYMRLAGTYLQAGDTGRAIRTYMAVASVYPDYPEAYMMLGRVYFSKKDYPDAANALANVVRLEPGNPDAHYNLAQALRLKGDLASAARQYQQAIALRPGFSKAYAGLEETGAAQSAGAK